MPYGLIAATGWTSGLNLYGTALLLGLAGRFGWAETPEQLQQTWVLVVLGVLYALEFVVDKVPWADSAWDAVHTVIRPLGGALLGGLIAHDAGDPEVVAAMLSGTFSLTAHSAKAGTRAMVNTSPEPVSNSVLSLGEDGVVAAMVALALAFPVVAGILAVVFAIASAAVAVAMFKAVRALQRRWKARRGRGPVTDGAGDREPGR